MPRSLKSRLISALLSSAAVIALALFLPAGTLRYWQAWTFFAIVFVPMILGTFYFYRRDPQLIERRLLRKEPAKDQRFIMRVLRPVFFLLYLLPGFDYRFGWTRDHFGGVPLWLTILAQCLALAGYLMTFWVMRENSFAAAVVRVEEGQRVISTGPYRIVRHPMYFGALIMMLFTPLALGSIVTLPAFALVIPVLVFRLRSEERILTRDLPGYVEFTHRTRYRLVPFVW